MLSSTCGNLSRFAAKITVTINGRALEAKRGETIIQLADRHNISIPRLCYHPCLPLQGSCGICAVQVTDKDGKESLSNACVTKVANGLKVETKSQRVIQAVQGKLQDLLNVHDERCTSCVANSRCEFRNLAFSNGVSTLKACPPIPDSVDTSSAAVQIDPSKCVLCKRCVRACKNISGQKAIKIGKVNGRECVQTSSGAALDQTTCVQCGQCTLYCPVGAITERPQVREVQLAIKNHEKKAYVVQVDPSVCVAISEAFNLPAGTVSTGKVVAALKRLGFDMVFDSAFGADIHALQGAEELIAHLKNKKAGAMITSTCPAFIKFVEQSKSQVIPQVSQLKTPGAIMAAYIKSTLPEKLNVKPQEIYSVIVSGCTAKKGEIQGDDNTDVVLTVRELVEMIKSANISFAELPEEAFEQAASGAGKMYATSGGAMEATLRAAYQKLNGKKMPKPVIQKIRGMQAQKVTEVDLGTEKVKVAVVQGLANAMKFLDKVKKDKALKDVKFVEILSCPGGCVVGGGTPKPETKEAMEQRVKGIYALDAKATMKCAADNQQAQEALKGMLHNAHGMLHTAYVHRPGF